ncbi:MAG TPA: RDD family protein [Microthrixaceae bacterium]|nr:RDD family protein [Microthrixaceae bacterium]
MAAVASPSAFPPTRTGIITPEAVVLELPAAGVATRLLARFVDLALQGAILLVGILVVTQLFLSSGATDSVAVRVAVWILVIVVLFGLPIVTEALWHGRTPGKALLGLRAVTIDGGPIETRHAVVRGLFLLVDVYMTLGLIPALMTRRSQRFGDLAAGTFVLAERGASGPATPIAFSPPPGWDAYVAAMDVGRVDEQQYRLIRSYLLRVSELDRSARWHLAVKLADAVRSQATPDPPAGIPPETYLHCVASAYQLRAARSDPSRMRT